MATAERRSNKAGALLDRAAAMQLNQLLSALPPDLLERWQPRLEWLKLPLGQVLYESGDTLTHVVFPSNAIVSLLYFAENGSTTNLAVVGAEGLVGISAYMGGGSTPSRAVVQIGRAHV